MPRTIAIETTVFTYDELNEAGQEAVREWVNLDAWESGSAADRMEDIAADLLDNHELEIRPGSLVFNLYTQGGMPAFSAEGRYVTIPYMAGGPWFVTITKQAYSGSLYGMYVELTSETGEPGDGDAQEVQAWLDGIVRHLNEAFLEEDAALGSDDYAREMCEANGWEFTADGKVF